MTGCWMALCEWTMPIGAASVAAASVAEAVPGKTPSIAAVACTPQGHPLLVRMDKVDGFRKTILADWTAQVLVPGCQVVVG